ncbi:MAG: hypothetical protein ACTSR8_11045 [Promethearchaeota archaeon]
MYNLGRLALKAAQMARKRNSSGVQPPSSDSQTELSFTDDMLLEEYFLKNFRMEFFKIIGKNPKSIVIEDLEMPILTVFRGAGYNYYAKSVKYIKKTFKWFIQELRQYKRTLDELSKDALITNLQEKLKIIIHLPLERISRFIEDLIEVTHEKNELASRFMILVNDEIILKLNKWKQYYDVFYEQLNENIRFENTQYNVSIKLNQIMAIPSSLKIPNESSSTELIDIMTFVSYWSNILDTVISKGGWSYNYYKYNSCWCEVKQDFNFIEYLFERVILILLVRGMFKEKFTLDQHVELFASFIELLSDPYYTKLRIRPYYRSLLKSLRISPTTLTSEVDDITHGSSETPELTQNPTIDTPASMNITARENLTTEIQGIEASILKIGELYDKQQVSVEKYLELYETYQNKLKLAKLKLDKLILD